MLSEARIDMRKSEIDKEVVEKVGKKNDSDYNYGLRLNDLFVMKQVWDRIAPGLASQFDAPYSVPVIAPRPLYLLNGEHSVLYVWLIINQLKKKKNYLELISFAGAEDPRCPLGGLVVPLERAKKAYNKTASPGNFKVHH